MARMATREVIESLGAFLRRRTAQSDEDIQQRIKDLDEGRMRAPDSSSEAFHREVVLPSVQATRTSDDGSVKNGEPSVASGTTKVDDLTAGDGLSTASGDPRLIRIMRSMPPMFLRTTSARGSRISMTTSRHACWRVSCLASTCQICIGPMASMITEGTSSSGPKFAAWRSIAREARLSCAFC